jgi:hypothetical protein
MPKEGYSNATISTDVMEKAKAYIEKVNEKAGYKKIRNVSHLIEEAVISFTIDQISRESQTSDEMLAKVVGIVLARDNLLGLLCKGLLEMPREEARAKLHKLLEKKDVEAFRKLLGR